MRLSRPLKLALFAAAALAVAAPFALRIRAELGAGQPVFWLAELWPPAAVLCIGLVTCLDWLLEAEPVDGAAPRKRPARPRRRSR